MTRHTSFPIKRQGFTLIEILVVLAIVAIVSSVTLGGFKEMAAGNKRLSCQTNLTQIYQAARLYAADESGKFPFYNSDCATAPTSIGLWSLYTFPDKNDIDGDSKIWSEPAPVKKEILPASVPAKFEETGVPIERYIRNAKVLHCPSDLSETSGQSNKNLYTTADKKELNLGYLSYQACDNGLSTYNSIRDRDPGTTLAEKQEWKRQLLHYDDNLALGAAPDNTPIIRQPTGNTIVTYCLHHRGERKMDNVLFYDGTVQLLDQATVSADNWKRSPKAPQ